MNKAQRPLSPHLQVYRWRVTMLLSTLHRLTGLLLSLGAVALAVWLIGIASGAETYQDLQQIYGAAWFKIPLVGWTFCLFLHLFNGVRHLVWDGGYGFGQGTLRASGWSVLVVTIVVTAVFSLVVIV
jgi:succinate dehydrogenase / fumarate reductase, cytochrome b subunit